ncbi:hypothetical protein Tco_0368211 [Tanacetum coccineum]
MDTSKRGYIPMQERLNLNKTKGASTPEEMKHMQNVSYASEVGFIMYAIYGGNPEAELRVDCRRRITILMIREELQAKYYYNEAEYIAASEAAVEAVWIRKFISGFGIVPTIRGEHGEPRWSVMKTILKYLRNTKDMLLVYGGNPIDELRVDCYYDAGFETDRYEIKSQTLHVFVLNRGAMDWKSSKQSTTTMSATKAKFIVASEAAMEAVWIRKFISGLGIVPTINEPIKMFCDNSAALLIANEPGVQRGARHYHRRYHYVRECIELGEINLLKVHIDDNLIDPFTKALLKGKLTQTC